MCPTVGDDREINLIIQAKALGGIGSSAILTLGTVFIDENLSEEGTPMALAYFHAAGYAFGPATGIIGGGALLKVWVDGNDKIPTDIPSELWVGNWWIGFLLVGGMVIVVGLLIIGLPHKLSVGALNQRRRSSTVQRGLPKASGELRQTGKTIFAIVKNIPFMMMVVAYSLEGGFIAIMATYSAKYTLEMFGGSYGDIAMIGGAAMVTSVVGGQFLGGIWVRMTNANDAVFSTHGR